MLNSAILIVIVAVVVFEIVEHVVLPLSFAIIQKRRRSPCGAEGLIGREGTVISWSSGSGRVFVEGERWKARGAASLAAGEKVAIRAVQGTVLEVALLGDERGPATEP
jgi:membrane-bound ClpP family serine protease